MKVRFSHLVGAATVAAAVTVPVAANAAQDMFLKIEGVSGESVDKVHKGELDVYSFSLGLSNSGTTHIGGGAGAGKANVQDLSVSVPISKASPTLALYCATGQHIPSAKLTVRANFGANATPVDFYVVTLTEVIISSAQNGGSGGGEKPVENYTLNFSKIEWSYTPVDATGKPLDAVKHTFDIPSNIGE
jgi:type VI secretion system secreted protein Hcp